MKIIVIGDVHGDYDILREIQKHTDGDLYLQVGDLSGDSLARYPSLEKPLLFISGNKENADILYKDLNHYDKFLIKDNLWYLPNGCDTVWDGVRILGVGGIYSPKDFFKHKKDLQGRRRLHYTYREILQALACHGRIDILLTHEAPCPFMVSGKFMTDRGRPEIAKLDYALQPMYHFFGHHHVATNSFVHHTNTRCIPRNSVVGIEI
jgi:Icc-related predicted phosphoesterase